MMKITKLDHSGFYIENGGRGMAFDPVEYRNRVPMLRNVDVIVITHGHGDHYQPAVLNKIVVNNPGVRIFTTADNVVNIPGAFIARPGDKVQMGAFSLEFFGSGKHAPIFGAEAPGENIGTIVNGQIVNSGDSFDMPTLAPIRALMVPLAAPWLRIEESVRYMEQLRPRTVINTHDGMLSEMGFNIINNVINQRAAGVSAQYKFLRSGEGVEV